MSCVVAGTGTSSIIVSHAKRDIVPSFAVQQSYIMGCDVFLGGKSLRSRAIIPAQCRNGREKSEYSSATRAVVVVVCSELVKAKAVLLRSMT